MLGRVFGAGAVLREDALVDEAPQGRLSEDEKDTLAELEEGCHDDHAISAACSALIGDERRARIAMRQMSPEQRSEFRSQPIARFLGNQVGDS